MWAGDFFATLILDFLSRVCFVFCFFFLIPSLSDMPESLCKQLIKLISSRKNLGSHQF